MSLTQRTNYRKSFSIEIDRQRMYTENIVSQEQDAAAGVCGGTLQHYALISKL